MKKTTVLLLMLLFFIPTIAVADVYQYAADTYTTPSGWTEIATTSGVTNLDHYQYYLWVFDDINYVPSAVNIVFHKIRDWTVEKDQLAVYLVDSISGSAGWYGPYSDNQSTGDPNWSVYSPLGIWSDPAGGTTYYDVVFTIPSATDRASLSAGSLPNFLLGIDPDCHYYLNKITVDVAPPSVPEPATMLLLGLGLIGLAGVRRRMS